MHIASIEKIIAAVTLYRILLADGTSYTAHSGTLKRLGLKEGREVFPEAFAADIGKAEAAEAREFALRSLAARGRTAVELKGILVNKGFSELQGDDAVSWIREKGLLDEETLLEDTAEALLQRKGVRQVRQILRQRGFSGAEAERVLKAKAGDPDLYHRVLRQAKRKLGELQVRYPRDYQQRLGAWLYGRGHDGDLIRRVLGALKVRDAHPED